MRHWVCGAVAALAATTSIPALAKGPKFAVSITRTSYGIPHIRAGNWSGIGYGVGYAYAQDNLCMLAEEYATIAGDRSRFFGPKNVATLGFDKIDNLSSDVFFRSVIDLPALRKGYLKQSAAARALMTGYVAGYNRLLRDLGPMGVPAECRGKPWVRPIARDDLLRLSEKQMLLASSLALAPMVVAAAPPAAASSASPSLPKIDPLEPRDIGFGSNGWAFGSELTENGRGVLVGNPHFPWNGPSRFYEMHLTIPGVLDVMGVSIAGAPTVTLGFNKDVAWTHTVTAARHFTIFELKLDPADATAYLIDGKSEQMGKISVSVPMPDGAAPVVRTLYTTRYGPVVFNPLAGFVWTKGKAFALADANRDNQRSLDTWIAIDQARSVADIKHAVSHSLGIPWVNTIATDRTGAVLHADVTAVPNVSAKKAVDCATPLSATLASRLILLDGSRSACGWDSSPGTAAPGLLPASEQAIWERRDYVANSNDNYWLSNAAAPYRQLSPILGLWGTERSLRTRSGLVEIARRLNGSDGLGGTKITQKIAEAMAFANRSLAADLMVDPLLRVCKDQPELADPCQVLQKWDRRYDLDSRGAYLFMAFFEALKPSAASWATPFDPADPVHTPRDLRTDGEAAGKIVAALRSAVDRLGKEGIAIDAPWSRVQFAVRGADHVPIHGGSGQLGILNVQQSAKAQGGIVPFHGTSYIQVVTFDDKGPVADALLSYSQSTDPASPYFADQTRAFSAKKWHRLPFTSAEIAADGAVTSRISE